MVPERDAEYLNDLVHNLRQLSSETEWVEFKENNADSRMMGEDIAALANGAALLGREKAYMLWGIADGTHAVVGTDFVPGIAKGRGNEPLENWLLTKLYPQVNFSFHQADVGGNQVIILEIDPAVQAPIAFEGERFIRVGSATKKLKDFQEKERALWRILERIGFEDGVAEERLSDDEVLDRLNYTAYFALLERPIPESVNAILYELEQDRLITPCAAGGWNITNLGAILFANRIGDFRRLERKSIRVIQYQGTGRTESVGERQSSWGYAAGFANLLKYINGRIYRENIQQGLRRTLPMVPEVAVRELVANALIHQDFSVTGSGPMVEIFDSRIEITNPGAPLIDTQRFLGNPPISRNETLASLMRRIGICEERGSGIEKAVSAVEAELLPAPLFESYEGFTRATLFAHKDLSEMDRAERVRACYLHACLCYRLRQPMNNTSLRERFGMDSDRTDTERASRLLREAVEDGSIVVRDPSAGTRNWTYLPFWAA